MYKHFKNKLYYAIKPCRRIPKIKSLLLILMIIQFSGLVAVSIEKDTKSTTNNKTTEIKKKESIPKGLVDESEPINRQAPGSRSLPTTREDLERQISDYINIMDKLKADLTTEKNRRVNEKKDDEERARKKYMALEKQYADMETKKNAAIANLEKTQKTVTDLEKTNTILSWMVFLLSIFAFLTTCILYFKFKFRPCCAEQTVKEIIPEKTADRSTQTSLQFIQDQEYWSSTSTSSSTLFGSETCEVARHHFRPTNSSSESPKPNNLRSTYQFRLTETREIDQHHFRPTNSSSESPKPNNLRSNHHYQLTKSSRTSSNNEL